MQPRVAAITMAYNEATLLPIWARHYARQVGADHCFVIDHGSTDPIVVPPGVNTLRLPRSPHDDERRAGFVSNLAQTLLSYFDWVLYTDADELVLADPDHAPNLQAFCASAPDDTITAIGLDVQHRPDCEPPLNPALPVGRQRGWVRFTSAMCKPVLTRRPIRWDPGFHSCDQPPRFAPLFLFHLHWADRTLGQQRLARTRAMRWASDTAGRHARLPDRHWLDMFDGMARLPIRDTDLRPAGPPLDDWLAATLASRPAAGGPVALDVNAPELWPIPPRFRAALG